MAFDIPDSQSNYGLEYALFRKRVDLWAISKVLKYCKASGLNKIVWDWLPPEDKKILQQVSAGIVPDSFS